MSMKSEFIRARETVATVSCAQEAEGTPLKRGVNENQRMAKARRLFAVATTAVGIVGVVALTGCTRSHAQPKPVPPTVTVAPVEQREIVEWDEFTGRTVPVELVEVRPRVSGHIQEIHFESGSLVKKGDVLVKIDPRWHQAEFEHRQADYAQAKVH